MRWLAVPILAVAAPSASAQGVYDRADLLTNTYVGVNIGQADYRWRNPPAGASEDLCSPGLLECRNDPIGWKAYAGYMFLPWVGVEASVYSMGDARVKGDLGGGAILEQTIRVEGYALSAVGALPLGPVTLNARGGYAASTGTRTDTLNGTGVGRTQKSRAEPIFGVGVGLRAWRGLFVRLDWDRARARTVFGEKFEADLYSLGVGWQF
jgi:hypothetical protein